MEFLEDFPAVVVQQDAGGSWKILGLAAARGPTVRIENVEVQLSAIAPPSVNGGMLLGAVSSLPRSPAAALSENFRSGGTSPASPTSGSGQLPWSNGAFSESWGLPSHLHLPAFPVVESGDSLQANSEPQAWIPAGAPDRKMWRSWRMSTSRRLTRIRDSQFSLWQSVQKVIARTAACGAPGHEWTDSPSRIAPGLAAHNSDSEEPVVVVDDGGVAAAAAAMSTGFACALSMSVDALAKHMLEIGDSYVHNMGVRIFEALSETESNCQTIAESHMAMKFLTEMLSMSVNDSNSMTSCHASRAFANIAKFETHARHISVSPVTMEALVHVLLFSGDAPAQQGAASTFANLATWRHGVKAMFGTRGAVHGLVQVLVSPTMVAGDQVLHHCQSEAARALVTLAQSRRRNELLEYPTAMVVLAQLIDVSDPQIYERASIAFAELSFTVENAQKIGELEGFIAILDVLARVLLRPHHSEDGFQVRELYLQKMVTITLANLCVTEDAQLMIAEFPNVLKGLFHVLELRGPEEQMEAILQVQEGAAMTLGNLALAQPNRQRILDFGPKHLSNLARLMYHKLQHNAQEFAAWAIGNLTSESEEGLNAVSPAAVPLGAVPAVLGGLAELLAVAKQPLAMERSMFPWARLNHRQIPTFRILEEAARAAANLARAQETHWLMVQIPGLLQCLASMAQHNAWVPVDCQIHAARAIANFSLNLDIQKSERGFELVFKSVEHMVACRFADEAALNQMREFGTLALSRFSVEPAHQWKIVRSAATMTSLTDIISSSSTATLIAKEHALFTIGNLAHATDLTVVAVANVDYLVDNLRALQAGPPDTRLPALARVALKGMSSCLWDNHF